jgi:hypothetical protein
MSETPEHIEIGVQILAPETVPAVLFSVDFPEEHVPALILSEQRFSRTPQRLIVPANTVDDQNRERFLIARKNETPHPVIFLNPREQSGQVEVFLIVETLPDVTQPESGGGNENTGEINAATEE